MIRRGIVAKEGYPFIAGAFLFFFIVYLLGAPCWLNFILLAFFVFTVAFFRDPNRRCSGVGNEVLCPADGTIVSIDHYEKDRFLDEPTVKISIFMSPFNVHVNRAPLAGTVENIIYNEGKYFNAKSEKASLDNEQNALIMKLKNGRRIVVNQIAGLIARRIVCRVGTGTLLGRGERFGIIRFGSRVDLHLPPDTKVLCGVGERVYAGDTIMGVITDGK